MIRRKSLKAWVANKGGGNCDKRNVIIIESTGCPGRGGEILIKGVEIVIRRKSLKAWVANKGGGGGEIAIKGM